MAAGRLSSATVTLNPKDQKMEAIQRILAKVGGMAGCDHCGRIALLLLPRTARYPSSTNSLHRI